MEDLEPKGDLLKKTWFKPEVILMRKNSVAGGPNVVYNEQSLVTKSVVGTAVYFTNGKTGINGHTKHYYHS